MLSIHHRELIFVEKLIRPMKQALKPLIEQITKDPFVHAQWLNTLSFMENSGAKKISRFESKTDVSLLILKHAAEEHRHAYYLKKQISKLAPSGFENYDDAWLVSPKISKYYLDMLDLWVSKYIKKTLGLSGYELKWASYLLVTYAIEVRADELYPIYQEVLTAKQSKIQVKSIIVEEVGHLNEMKVQLATFSPDWEKHATVACDLENQLFQTWILSLTAIYSLN